MSATMEMPTSISLEKVFDIAEVLNVPVQIFLIFVTDEKKPPANCCFRINQGVAR